MDRFQRRLQGQRIDDGGKHTHLITFDAVEALFGSTQSAEDIAASDDDAYLHAAVGDSFHLFGILVETLGVDAVTLLSLQALAR